METTLYMAMSLNGFIAKEDGSEDFLSDDNWTTFKQLSKEYGNFIIGRKTYETIKSWSQDYSLNKITGVKKIVVSQRSIDIEKEYAIAKSPEDALKQLSETGFKKAILAGGSFLNTSFIKAGLIDNIIINIEPYIIGKGISLFASEEFESKLKLQETKELNSGIVQLCYKVVKSGI